MVRIEVPQKLRCGDPWDFARSGDSGSQRDAVDDPKAAGFVKFMQKHAKDRDANRYLCGCVEKVRKWWTLDRVSFILGRLTGRCP